tara:strand:+ start:66 stop:350 length:285 start_codon:yes stop_codon:yes gene_type:complete
MTQIEFNKDHCKWTESLKLISISETLVKFDTSYRLWNPLTRTGKVFEFSHATGPEFNPDTRWIYKSDDGFTLEIINDVELTSKRSKEYLNAKLN